MTEDDLTTAESWDRLWRASHGEATGLKSRLKSRLKSQRSWLRLLARLLDAPGKDRALDVLELGCAPGSMLMQLYRLRPQHSYRGLDIAPVGLDIARKRLADAGIAAELTFGDIRSAELAKADLVVSFGLAEHFSDLTEAIRWHRRFVKPGGMVAVTVPNYAHPVVVRVLRLFSPETLATHNLDTMSTTAIHAAMVDAGMKSIEVGESGGPTLPNSRPLPNALGTIYRFFARVWNVFSSILPERWPWSSTIWALGVNPDDD